MGKWRPSPTSLYFECSGVLYHRLFIQVLTLGCTAGIDVIIAFLKCVPSILIVTMSVVLFWYSPVVESYLLKLQIPTCMHQYYHYFYIPYSGEIFKGSNFRSFHR